MEDEFDMVPEHIHNLRKRGVEPLAAADDGEFVDVTTVDEVKPLDLLLPGNLTDFFAITMPVKPVV